MQMKSLLMLGLGLLVAFAVMSPMASMADRGVGVTVGRIDVNTRVRPGGQYALPSIGILNTGDQADDYTLGLTYLTNQPQMRPDAKWVAFSPTTIRIPAGESRTVEVSLNIPSGADPGEYFALLEASVGNAGTDSTLAGAATKLTFTVGPSSWLDTQKRRFDRWLDDSQPWTTIIPILLLGGVVLITVSKRVRFRLPFEPR
jgi:hypothetical protein